MWRPASSVVALVLLGIGCSTFPIGRDNDLYAPPPVAFTATAPCGLAIANSSAEIVLLTKRRKIDAALVGAAGGLPSLPSDSGVIGGPIFAAGAIFGALSGTSKIASRKEQAEADALHLAQIERVPLARKILAAIEAKTRSQVGTNFVIAEFVPADPAAKSEYLGRHHLASLIELDSIKVGWLPVRDRPEDARLFVELRSTVREESTGRILHQSSWRAFGDARPYVYSSGSLVWEESAKAISRVSSDLADQLISKIVP